MKKKILILSSLVMLFVACFSFGASAQTIYEEIPFNEDKYEWYCKPSSVELSFLNNENSRSVIEYQLNNPGLTGAVSYQGSYSNTTNIINQQPSSSDNKSIYSLLVSQSINRDVFNATPVSPLQDARMTFYFSNVVRSREFEDVSPHIVPGFRSRGNNNIAATSSTFYGFDYVYHFEYISTGGTTSLYDERGSFSNTPNYFALIPSALSPSILGADYVVISGWVEIYNLAGMTQSNRQLNYFMLMSEIGYDDIKFVTDIGLGGDIIDFSNISYTDWIVNSVKSFIDFEIFPNFSIGNILGLLITMSLAIWILKVFMGG